MTADEWAAQQLAAGQSLPPPPGVSPPPGPMTAGTPPIVYREGGPPPAGGGGSGGAPAVAPDSGGGGSGGTSGMAAGTSTGATGQPGGFGGDWAPEPVAPAAPPAPPASIVRRQSPGTAGGATDPYAPPPPQRSYAVQAGTDTFRPVARTVQRPGEIDPAIEGGFGSLDEAQMQAADARADAALGATDATLAGMDRAEGARKREDERYRQAQERLVAEARQREADWEATSAEIDAQSDIDPDRYWSKKGTWGGILTRLSIGLGTLGSGLTGAPNVALKMVEDEIARDIEAQKADIERARARGERKQTLYGMARERGMTEAGAAAATREAGYAQADRELAYLQAKASRPEQAAALEETRVGLRRKQVEAAYERRRDQAGVVSEQQQYDPKRTVIMGGGGGGDPAKARIAAKKAALEERELDRKLGTGGATQFDESDPKYVPGEGMARTDSAAEKRREQRGLNESLIRAAAELEQLIRENTTMGVTLDGPTRRRIAGAKNNLKLAKNRAEAGGAMSEGDAALYDTMVGTPEGLAELQRRTRINDRIQRENAIVGAPVAPPGTTTTE